MTYYDILFSFFIYGFLGWCSEVAFAAFKQHSFVNRGFLNGPICPIYGIGVTVVVASLQPYVGNLIFIYLHWRGAFGVARFDEQGNAKALTSGTSDRTGSTFSCIYTNHLLIMPIW